MFFDNRGFSFKKMYLLFVLYSDDFFFNESNFFRFKLRALYTQRF